MPTRPQRLALRGVPRQAKRRRPPPKGCRYDTSPWKTLRKQVLEEEPLCRCDEHQGKGDAPASTVVDHIQPHQGNEALFWDRENLRGMAKACHDRKTSTQDGGFGNPTRRAS